MSQVRVEVGVPDRPVQLGGRCPVAVAVVNDGGTGVVINRRLAVGYRDSVHRELFVEILRGGSDQIVGGETLLYDRPRATPDDYVTLGPGESVRTSFDLLEWYSVPGPGTYELVVSYEGDEGLAKTPAGTIAGVHSSNRVPINLVE